MSETTLSVVTNKALMALFGTCDQHVRRVREVLGVGVSVRDGSLHIEGGASQVARATEVFEKLRQIAHEHGEVATEDLERILTEANAGSEPFIAGAPVEVFKAGRRIRPRTTGQARYLEAIRKNDIVLCSGPAGTGKTYLAVATAVACFRQEIVSKLVLVRPAVEAGESLGFLPGDLQAKINPYLRPLMDALNEMMDFDMIQQLKEQDVIEVIPLAYMRGRTLSDAFIILDEAQNTTVAQMKMFLTRMGENSKIVVAGDTSQIDLPSHTRSGLIDALARLSGIEGIASVKLSKTDIVRNPLIQKIVSAYEKGPGKNQETSKRR